MSRAPAVIQGQILSLVEAYASEPGFESVTLEVVQEARRNLMDAR